MAGEIFWAAMLRQTRPLSAVRQSKQDKAKECCDLPAIRSARHDRRFLAPAGIAWMIMEREPIGPLPCPAVPQGHPS